MLKLHCIQHNIERIHSANRKHLAQNAAISNFRNVKQSSHSWNGLPQNVPECSLFYVRPILKISLRFVPAFSRNVANRHEFPLEEIEKNILYPNAISLKCSRFLVRGLNFPVNLMKIHWSVFAQRCWQTNKPTEMKTLPSSFSEGKKWMFIQTGLAVLKSIMEAVSYNIESQWLQELVAYLSKSGYLRLKVPKGKENGNNHHFSINKQLGNFCTHSCFIKPNSTAGWFCNTVPTWFSMLKLVVSGIFPFLK